MDDIKHLAEVSILKNHPILAATISNNYSGVDAADAKTNQNVGSSFGNPNVILARNNIPGSLKRKVMDDFQVSQIVRTLKPNNPIPEIKKKRLSVDRNVRPRQSHTRSASNPKIFGQSENAKNSNLVTIRSSKSNTLEVPKDKSKPTSSRKSEPRSRTGSIDISLILDENAVLKESEPGKLPHSYATIITYAILHHPQRRMSLSEIYNWVSEQYPHVKNSGIGWKNSIRHNLSLNRIFTKLQKSGKKSGKGSLWTVDFTVLGEAITQGAKKRRISPEILFSTGLWSHLGFLQSSGLAQTPQTQNQKESLGQYLKDQFSQSSQKTLTSNQASQQIPNNALNMAANASANLFSDQTASNFVNQFTTHTINLDQIFDQGSKISYDQKSHLGYCSNPRYDIIQGLCSSGSVNKSNNIPPELMADVKGAAVSSLMAYNMYGNSNSEAQINAYKQSPVNNQGEIRELKGADDINSIAEYDFERVFKEAAIRNKAPWDILNMINESQSGNQLPSKMFDVLSQPKFSQDYSNASSSASSGRFSNNLLFNYDLIGINKPNYLAPDCEAALFGSNQSLDFTNSFNKNMMSNISSMNALAGRGDPYCGVVSGENLIDGGHSLI